ncbi:MAG: hypothetical protein NTX49_01370 [Chlamydiae bacterium]|nr:hypothetical protein [Chlamydiota bacterium]
MRTFYVWICFLSVAGIVLSVFLFPTRGDLALIDLKSKKYSRAELYYKAEYAKGNSSADIIIPLSQIEEKLGHINESIALIKEYIQSHPNDVEALELLASLYQINQEYEAYFTVLLRLEKLQESSRTLKALSDYYEASGDNQARRLVLEKLVTKEEAESIDYLHLAHSQAEKKHYKKAVNLLSLRRKRFLHDVTIDDMIFEVWLVMQISKEKGGDPELEKKAMRILAHYLIHKNKTDMAYYSLGTVQEHYPNQTGYFIQELHPLLSKHPSLEVASLAILWDQSSQPKKILQRLIQLYSQDSTSPELQNLLFNIFIEKNDSILLVDMIRSSDVERLEDRTVTSLLILGATKGNPLFAKELQCAYKESYVRTHPFIRVELAIGAQDPKGIEELREGLQNHSFSQVEKLLLVKLLAAQGLEGESLALNQQLIPYEGLEDSDLLDLALSFNKMKKSDELYKSIESSIAQIGEEKAGPALALLNITLHRSKKAAAWLYTQKNVDFSTLALLQEAAQKEKEYPLALYIAKRQLQAYPSPLSQADYGLALVQVGKVEAGVTLLNQDYLQNPDDSDVEATYFQALVLAAKASPHYQGQLREFMQEREKLGLVPVEMLRDFAYAYLSTLDEPDSAEKLFARLARGSSVAGDDMQALFYLWGPQVSEQKKQWIETQAKTASDEDFGPWMKELIFIGDYDMAIQLYNQRNSPSIEAHFAYMDALIIQKNYLPVRKTIDKVSCESLTTEQLTKLADYAEASQYVEGAQKIAVKIQKRSPNDPASWQRLAKLSYEDGDYEATSFALTQFFTLCNLSCDQNPNLYESLFERAEVIDHNHKHSKAKKYYHLALAEIHKAKYPTFAMQEREVLIWYKLGSKTRALRLMYKLYERSGRDPNVAASFAGMLMDMAYLKQAKQLLKETLGNEIHREDTCSKIRSKKWNYEVPSPSCPITELFECESAPQNEPEKTSCPKPHLRGK